MCFLVYQKTAYEMRISDWSSDVCSSDLFAAVVIALISEGRMARDGATLRLPAHRAAMSDAETALWEKIRPMMEEGGMRPPRVREIARSEERRVGKEGVRTCRSRWEQDHSTTKQNR